MKDGKPWRVRRAESLAAGVVPTRVRDRVSENHNPHAQRGIKTWNQLVGGLPKLFNGQTVAIVGGGPSLIKLIADETLVTLCEQHPEVNWIAVNNAYKIVPWADILHFADCEWWRWNSADVLKNFNPRNHVVTTATSDTDHVKDSNIKRFWRDRIRFTRDKDKLHGWDSGTQAVNLAYHLGAKRIVLFGFDMTPAADGKTQWHNDHKRSTLTANYAKKFKPALQRVFDAVTPEKVVIVRATKPGLETIPYLTPALALAPEALTL